MTSASVLPAATHLGRTALLVSDLESTTTFYRDVVGLAVLARDPSTATLGVDDTPLLELVEDEDALSRPRSAAGLYHNAFRVPSRAALGDALARIRDRWRLDGVADHLVSEALYLSDPEGNGVEIYRDRPRDAWPIEEDGSVGMDTLPLDLDDLADDAAGIAAAPTGTTLGHVHLEVSSLARAHEFYAETLGLGVRQAFGESALFLAAGEYHHHVGLNSWHGRSAPTSGRGLAWFEVVVPDEATLTAARTRLVEGGYSVTEGGSERERSDVDAGRGTSTASRGGIDAVDPDGITVRLRADT